MPRTPRVEVPRVCYHVITRGNRQEAIFHDDLDRRHYLGRLEHYRRRYGFTLYAYVLMTNHVHLLETAELLRYIHLNPGRTQQSLDPWRYPWSSHAAYMGKPSAVTVETSLLLRQFAPRLDQARRAYLVFMANGLAQGDQPQYEDTGDPRCLDGEEFIRKAVRTLALDRGATGPEAAVPFDSLLRAVADVYGLTPAHLLRPDRRRDMVSPRAMLVFLAREWSRLRNDDLGQRLRRDPSMISRLYARYAEGRDRSAEAKISQLLRPDP